MTTVSYPCESAILSNIPSPRLIVIVGKNPMTHFSAIFKYANVGVKRSAAIDAVTGSRLGGKAEFLDLEITSRAVSRDGMVTT
jgi:hypothetical protein